ncbi:MAG: hypothetical protein AB1716_16945 [Planctomycetota bacterium]
MSPSPIRKALSTFNRHGVRALLMGGQACVLYGAAEFTRDSDFAVASDEANLARLRAALRALRARRVYVPGLSAAALDRGHACHFRWGAPGPGGHRLDVMGVLRGCDEFARLWQRRITVRLAGGVRADLLAVEDLVAAKKTQRDKDWPMIARLVQADYLSAGPRPATRRVEFWLREARTPELLSALVRRFPARARRLAGERRAVAAALAGDVSGVRRALRAEEERERAADRAYWAPLRTELAAWRRKEIQRRRLLKKRRPRRP